MNKIILIQILIFIPFIIGSAQLSLITVNVEPDSNVTIGNMVFHCTISNPTKKNYKYLIFDPNCEDRFYPNFWKISIKKDSTTYFDCSLEFVLRNRISAPEVILFKKSVRKFNFCLNFNKLIPDEDLSNLSRFSKSDFDSKKMIQNYNNDSYGTYEVQISYCKNPFDPYNPLTLVSNWTKVQYVHKQ
jgi:hypothetical protein